MHWVRHNGKDSPLDDNDRKSATFLYTESIVTFYMGCLYDDSSLLNIYFCGMKDSIVPLILSYTDNALKFCDCCSSSSSSPILFCCKTAKRYIRNNDRRYNTKEATRIPLDYDQMEVPPSLFINDNVLLWDEHASVSCCAYYETYTPIITTTSSRHYQLRDKDGSARQSMISSLSTSSTSSSTSWICDASPMITWNSVDGPSYFACTPTMLYSTYFQFPLDCDNVGSLKDFDSIEYNHNPITNKHSICFWKSNWTYRGVDEKLVDGHNNEDKFNQDVNGCDSKRRAATRDMESISIVHGIGGTIIETRIALQLYKLIKKTLTTRRKRPRPSNTSFGSRSAAGSNLQDYYCLKCNEYM